MICSVLRTCLVGGGGGGGGDLSPAASRGGVLDGRVGPVHEETVHSIHSQCREGEELSTGKIVSNTTVK